MESVFSGDMCVRENTSQAARVGFVRLERTNPAHSGLHLTRKSGKGHLFDSLRRDAKMSRLFLFCEKLDIDKQIFL